MSSSRFGVWNQIKRMQKNGSICVSLVLIIFEKNKKEEKPEATIKNSHRKFCMFDPPITDNIQILCLRRIKWLMSIDDERFKNGSILFLLLQFI